MFNLTCTNTCVVLLHESEMKCHLCVDYLAMVVFNECTTYVVNMIKHIFPINDLQSQGIRSTLMFMRHYLWKARSAEQTHLARLYPSGVQWSVSIWCSIEWISLTNWQD